MVAPEMEISIITAQKLKSKLVSTSTPLRSLWIKRKHLRTHRLQPPPPTRSVILLHRWSLLCFPPQSVTGVTYTVNVWIYPCYSLFLLAWTSDLLVSVPFGLDFNLQGSPEGGFGGGNPVLVDRKMLLFFLLKSIYITRHIYYPTDFWTLLWQMQSQLSVKSALLWR